jgi:hypothetical protein
VEGFCEYYNEISDCLKCGNLLTSFSRRIMVHVVRWFKERVNVIVASPVLMFAQSRLF